MNSTDEVRAASHRLITFGFLLIAIISLVFSSCANGFALPYPSPYYAEVAERTMNDDTEVESRNASPSSQQPGQPAAAFAAPLPRSFSPNNGNSVGGRLSLRSFSGNADDAVVWMNGGGDPRCILCRTNFYGRTRRFLKRK